MRRFFSAFLIIAVSFLASAQEIVLTPLAPNFCKPGVENKSPSKGVLLEYGLQPSYNVNSSASDAGDSRISRNSQLHFKIKIPVVIKESFYFLLGADYQRERFRFDYIDEGSSSVFRSIDADALRTTRLSAYFLKSLNSRIYTSLKLEGSFNGDYSGPVNFEDRYAIYRGALILGIKKSENKEMGIGAQFSKGFRNTRVLPFFFYNHTYSDKWGIETVLPVSIRFRYNLNSDNIFLFGPQFRTRTYSIDIDEPLVEATNVFHMRRSQLELSAAYQHQFSDWIWGEFKLGYRYHFDTRFERKTSNGFNPADDIVNLITASQSAGPLFQLGIFISPPKNR